MFIMTKAADLSDATLNPTQHFDFPDGPRKPGSRAAHLKLAGCWTGCGTNWDIISRTLFYMSDDIHR